MKTTGILKRFDELGRVVIPKKIAKGLGITAGDELEVFVDADKIILRKYQTACIFCGAEEHIKEHKGKPVCEDCIAEMQRL